MLSQRRRSADAVAAAKTMASILQTQWWQLHGRGCLTWTCGGLIINELFKRFGSKRSQEVIAGSPRFSWWNGVTHQFVVFPLLCGLCIAEHGGPFGIWLRSFGNEYYFHRMFHHAFFGYLVKDLTLPITPVLLAHHVVCLALVLASLCGYPSDVSALFCACVTSLELGSAVFGLQSQFPRNRTLHLLLFPWMTLSNFISASFGVWYSLHYEDVGVVSRIIFPVVGIGLCAARQAVENARFRNWPGKEE